jgi:putative DNA primase/helicase
MRMYGLETQDPILGDGHLHRIHITGDATSDRSGWYILHLDSKPAGMFGCNRRYPDEKFSWTDKSQHRPMSLDERREWKAKMADQERRRITAEQERHRMAAERAVALWNAATDEPTDSDYPYLGEKGVKAFGLRVGRWEYLNEETGEVSVVSDRALLIPIRDRQNVIHSLQAILPDNSNFLKRRKDYLKYGAKRGNFHAIGKPQMVNERPVFIICEGYATGASIHMATGHCVLVTFDISNLAPVAKSIRERRADAIIIIAADNDQWTLTPIENPGVHYGKIAAKQVAAGLAFPPFTHAHGHDTITEKGVKRIGPTDFNDYHAATDLEQVADIFLDALEHVLVDEIAAANDQVMDATLEHPQMMEVDLEDGPAMLATSEDEPPFDDTPPPAEPGGMDPVDGYDDDELVKNKYFTILGYDGGNYYLFNHAKGQVMVMQRRDMNVLGLIEHAPLNWWQEYFPAGGAAKVDNVMAAEWIFHRAHSMGIYDPTRVRGRGAWTDDSRAIYHHGPFLTVDGQRVDLTKITSGYVYTRAKALPNPHASPLTNEEGEHLVYVATMPRWTMPGSAALMAGWVMLAPICGALNWRPHIWLTGSAGTGKTTLQAKFCGALTRGTNVYAQGNSTEAGLRQVLAGDALPVMIDEFESNDEKERHRVENIMSLIRQTSSETQAKTYKGTTTGGGMRFDIRSMFCLSSVNTNLPTKADIDRLTVLRLKAGDNNNWDELEAYLNSIDQDPVIASRLMARILNLLPVILSSVKVFRRVAAKHFDRQRDGDQFGTLLAGCWCLKKDYVPSEAEAEAMIKDFDWSEHREEADMDEADKALTALLSAKVRMGSGLSDLTIYELVRETSPIHRQNKVDVVTAEDTLRRHGIIADHGRKVLVFGTSVPNLKSLVRDLSSITDLRNQLTRVKEATKGDKAVSFNGAKSKTVMVPLMPILGDDPDGDDPF